MDNQLFDRLSAKFRKHFGQHPAVAAYAPGRVEVLGNHTDYNEGYVLSAAINMGTFFLAAPSPDSKCRLVASDIDAEAVFDSTSRSPEKQNTWSNYVKGVFSGLQQRATSPKGFLGMFEGNLPLGAGLSSSAALEMSSGVALAKLYKMDVPKLDLARIGQKAEHEFAGVKCGLLDQISSLFGKDDQLVMSDFRTLDVKNVPIGNDVCFLMCNTKAKHALVDGAYNERRAKCEEAAAFFRTVLSHKVTHLRDVSWAEWQEHHSKMDPGAAKRSAHVIGENTRVLKGKELLGSGLIEDFGKLMFESHESSISNFENSCPELDFLVSTARKTRGVLGARLSGGGFGGSIVALVHPRDSETITTSLNDAYCRHFGHNCDIRVIKPSAGALEVKI